MQSYQLENGAKKAIDRICQAYGFTNRVRLADYLGINASSIGNRIARDNYPHDLVLKCALETGAPLHWLATGELKEGEELNLELLARGADNVRAEADKALQVSTLRLKDHRLIEDSTLCIDRELMPSSAGEVKIIKEHDCLYFVDFAPAPLTEGLCLIEYSNQIHLKEITNLPGNKIRIDLVKFPIDCDSSDVKVIGKVLATFAELK